MADRLTKTMVDAFQGEPGKQSFLWDGEVSGFGIRVTPAGVKSYILSYRNKNAQKKRITIGRHGVFTPDTARARAKELLREVAHGDDPMVDRQEARQELTLAAFWTIYDERHAKVHLKPRTAHTDALRYEKHLKPVFGSMVLSAINSRSIERFKARLATDRKIVFNRCLALLSSMLNTARRWEYLEGPNPCELVQRFPENRRRRYMSPDEVLRFVRTLDALESESLKAMEMKEKKVKRPGGGVPIHIPCLKVLRFLLYSGQRRGEVQGLRWDWVDIGRGVIELPDSKTGQKTVYLNKMALNLLAGMPRESEYVFPGTKEGEPVKGFQRVWEHVLDKAELSDLKIHDLRHAYASIGVSQGLGLPIIGELLGHKQAATTARYSHLMSDPMKAAAELIGVEIERMMGGKAEIVEVGKPQADAKEKATGNAG